MSIFMSIFLMCMPIFMSIFTGVCQCSGPLSIGTCQCFISFTFITQHWYDIPGDWWFSCHVPHAVISCLLLGHASAHADSLGCSSFYRFSIVMSLPSRVCQNVSCPNPCFLVSTTCQWLCDFKYVSYQIAWGCWGHCYCVYFWGCA